MAQENKVYIQKNTEKQKQFSVEEQNQFISDKNSADVILAKTAGFCFGVKRAVDQVYEQVALGKKIYTYGPIIHNNEVVKDLENRGVQIINSEQELEMITEGTVIIRSHGVSKRVMDLLEQKGLDYIDMTCPFVTRIHDIVHKESPEKEIIIIGNAGHPEVEGIRGWAENGATVIGTVEEAESFQSKSGKPVCIVSQTTFNYNKFKDFVEIFEKKGYNVNVMNTLCDATRKRQEEAASIASDVDVMIVIGDLQSSNSKKLYEICQKECDKTHFVQTLQELQLNPDDSVRTIGITAGASTPNNIIEEVQNYVRNVF